MRTVPSNKLSASQTSSQKFNIEQRNMNSNKHKEQPVPLVPGNEHREQRQLAANKESDSKVSNVRAERVPTNTTDFFLSSDSSTSVGTHSASHVVSPDEKPQTVHTGDKMRSEGKLKQGVVIGSPEWYAEWNRSMALLKTDIADLQQDFKELRRKNDEQFKRLDKVKAEQEKMAQDPFMQYLKELKAFYENQELQD